MCLIMIFAGLGQWNGPGLLKEIKYYFSKETFSKLTAKQDRRQGADPGRLVEVVHQPPLIESQHLAASLITSHLAWASEQPILRTLHTL